MFVSANFLQFRLYMFFLFSNHFLDNRLRFDYNRMIIWYLHYNFKSILAIIKYWLRMCMTQGDWRSNVCVQLILYMWWVILQKLGEKSLLTQEERIVTRWNAQKLNSEFEAFESVYCWYTLFLWQRNERTKN